MDELTRQVEIKISRNELPIPIVNKVHIHSIYNPIKEACELASTSIQTLKENNHFLVLGLGFGYHLDEYLKHITSKNFKIIVIEPNQNIIQAFFKTRSLPSANITIKNYKSIPEYYYDEEFIDFLTTKPKILKLSTAFNLEKDFYRELLTFKSSKIISSYKDILNSFWADYFFDKTTNKTLLEMGQDIRNKTKRTKEDFLLLALQTKETQRIKEKGN